MRSKEVEKAINQLIVDINFSEAGCSTGIIEVKNINTALSYIETLEQLPNNIRDKIKELDKQYKEIESKYTEEQINMGSEDLDDYVEMQSIAKAEEALKSIIGE